MNNYIRELAECLEEAAAGEGISLGPTDTAICAAALHFLAATSEATRVLHDMAAGILAPPSVEAPNA